MTISGDCANGHKIRASYEITYISSSGTSITTCLVNETDCSNIVCKHELQNNTADSKCQPPIPQFNGENVTIMLTTRNIVGRSIPAVSSTISKLLIALLWSAACLQFEITYTLMKSCSSTISSNALATPPIISVLWCQISCVVAMTISYWGFSLLLWRSIHSLQVSWMPS